VIVICVFLALTSRAGAATCDEDAVALRTHLEREAHRAKVWNTAWMIGFATAAATQAALALTEYDPFGEFDEDDRDVLWLGTAKATLGVGVRVVRPLRARVPATSGDACADAAALRVAVADMGRRERQSFYLTHLGGLALNLTGAAILTVRRGLAVGALSFAISFPVAPLSAYTQPRTSWHLWREQRATWQLGVVPHDGGAMLWLGGML
jgi:hypothetical protein